MEFLVASALGPWRLGDIAGAARLEGCDMPAQGRGRGDTEDVVEPPRSAETEHLRVQQWESPRSMISVRGQWPL